MKPTVVHKGFARQHLIDAADDPKAPTLSTRGLAPAIIGAARRPAIDSFMQAAIDEAKKGRASGGIPIGSVIVHEGRIVGRGHNQRVQQGSVTLHGEMAAFENAGRQPAEVYRQSVIYTTLSPCSMCSGAILLYGIPKVVVGENRTFLGEEELLRSRGVEVQVLQDETCIRLMADFISDHPDLWNEDIGKPA